MLNPKSQFISALLSTLITISLFSIQVCLFLFCKSVHLYLFFDPTYGQYHIIFVFVLGTQCDNLQVLLCCYEWHYFILFNGLVIVHCVYVYQFSSVAQSCPTLCDPMNRSTPGLPVHHHFPEFTQTHVHRVRDAIQPSHSQSSPSSPTPNPSQHHSLFQ